MSTRQCLAAPAPLLDQYGCMAAWPGMHVPRLLATAFVQAAPRMLSIRDQCATWFFATTVRDGSHNPQFFAVGCVSFETFELLLWLAVVTRNIVHHQSVSLHGSPLVPVMTCNLTGPLQGCFESICLFRFARCVLYPDLMFWDGARVHWKC